MNAYQIADLEKLTGIRAHTIRIWEKRYQLIEPHRTQTNIRYYDDEQVKKLLKVATLLSQGKKISWIAALSEKQLNQQVKELTEEATEDVICLGFINQLTSAMLTFDETGFEKIFASAVIRFGMYEAMIRVFYPFLKKTGLMWSSSDVLPVHEHFASAIIRRKLIVAIDGLPAASKKGKTFLLFLPADEWHETGLLFSDYILRSKGFKTIYLGQNVPHYNLEGMIKNTSPTHLLTIYTARQDAEELQAEITLMARKNKNCHFLVSGNPDHIKPLSKVKNLLYLSSPADLLQFLKA